MPTDLTKRIGSAVSWNDTPASITAHTGEVAGSIAGAALPSVPCTRVLIRANKANTGNVYISASATPTVAANTTDTTTGLQLSAGQDTGWLNIPNLNMLHYISDGAGDGVTYMALGAGVAGT